MQSNRGISLLHSFFIAEVDEHLLIETPKIKKGKKENIRTRNKYNIVKDHYVDSLRNGRL